MPGASENRRGKYKGLKRIRKEEGRRERMEGKRKEDEKIKTATVIFGDWTPDGKLFEQVR